MVFKVVCNRRLPDPTCSVCFHIVHLGRLQANLLERLLDQSILRLGLRKRNAFQLETVRITPGIYNVGVNALDVAQARIVALQHDATDSLAMR